jgi:ketosteroid isomerase-like protein
MNPHEVVAAYWAAAEGRDWAAFGRLLAEDVVYRGPQPGLCFFELTDGGEISRITDFWPDPYELPDGRAHLAERY